MHRTSPERRTVMREEQTVSRGSARRATVAQKEFSRPVRRGPIVSVVAPTLRRMALETLSDDDVLSGLGQVLGQSPRVESSLIAHLAEVDARHLYARYASPSMFVYCRDVLHLSEGEAQLRSLVARAARGTPGLFDVLADGRLHLSGIAKLAPILTAENREALIPRAVH